MTQRFEEHFREHGIESSQDRGEGEGDSLIKKIEALLTQQEVLVKTMNLNRLKSGIYSYDIKENEYYHGLCQAEAFIKENFGHTLFTECGGVLKTEQSWE